MSEPPLKDDNDLHDGLGDWRFRSIAKIPYKGGWGLLTAYGELQAPTGETFEFTDFMATALYLNVAITADAQVSKLR